MRVIHLFKDETPHPYGMTRARMPVLFVGHGSPINAIETNGYTQEWARLAQQFPKPTSILCVSAHWVTNGTAVTAMETPTTIHDFYGFPSELNERIYPAPGSPELAARVKGLIKSTSVKLETEWGLDHGSWSVLVHMYPDADVPVVQLSLDAALSPQQRMQLGNELSALREEGVLILGTGNIVHNLGQIRPGAKPLDWALDFHFQVKECLAQRKDKELADFSQFPSAARAQPHPDHFWPLLYIVGAAEAREKPVFFNERMDMGSIDMMSVAFGLEKK